MKIITLNVRGLGIKGKFGWVKSICYSENPDLLVLQETRSKQIKNQYIYALWGNMDLDFIQKDAVGKSGGFLIIWNTKTFNATDCLYGEFFIALRGKWIVSVQVSSIVNVYGPHSDVKKKSFWCSLDNLLAGLDSAWVLCGDFNEVRNNSDRLNCVFYQRRADRFNEFIARNSLIEIPINGRKFTRISDDGCKLSKLDRFLVSESFLNLWKDLSVTPLDRKKSDHCPLILKDSIIYFGSKPFKVFNEWFNKDGVEDIIREAWNRNVTSSKKDCRFRDRLKNVKFALRDWSRNTFGNLDKEISDLKLKVESWE
ncbi:uncharacterized protein [Rutidosis leptorrhynchoides]|uniref:uncharacterized protein n=1 Tax=Rutidosis leptorrhynchoides TaxID=125765 RepID=UPI003A9917DC